MELLTARSHSSNLCKNYPLPAFCNYCLLLRHIQIRACKRLQITHWGWVATPPTLSPEVSSAGHYEKQILDHCSSEAKFQDPIKQNNPQVMANCWKYSPKQTGNKKEPQVSKWQTRQMHLRRSESFYT